MKIIKPKKGKIFLNFFELENGEIGCIETSETRKEKCTYNLINLSTETRYPKIKSRTTDFDVLLDENAICLSLYEEEDNPRYDLFTGKKITEEKQKYAFILGSEDGEISDFFGVNKKHFIFPYYELGADYFETKNVTFKCLKSIIKNFRTEENNNSACLVIANQDGSAPKVLDLGFAQNIQFIRISDDGLTVFAGSEDQAIFLDLE